MNLQEDNYEKQKNELEVIRSIYGSDILTAKFQDCWKKPCPLELTIHLQPHFTNEEVFAKFDMEIICSMEYPNNPPQIKFKNVVSLSKNNIEHLTTLLNKKALELIGCEMIYELCQLAQDYLLTHNTKPIKSEHENMLKTYELNQIEKERLRLDSENREMAEIAEENERRKAEKLKQKDEEGLDKKVRMLNFGELSECELVELLNPVIGNGEKKRIYKLSKSKLLRTPLHKMAFDYCAWDQTNQILVTEWTFEYTPNRKLHKKKNSMINFLAFEKRLEMFTRIANQKLCALKTNNQQFFSSFLFVNLKKISTLSTNFNCKILIGQNIDENDKCLDQILNDIQKKAYKFAPQLAAQITFALKWLHDQGFSHGFLQTSSIWFKNNQIFFLVDYFILPRLLELCQEFTKLINLNTKTENISTDETILKSQKNDLFCLGNLLKLVLGIKNDKTNNLSNDFTKCNYNDAIDFIKLCYSAKNVEELIDHQYLLHHLGQSSNDNDSNSNSELPKKLTGLSNSRLTKDFQVFKYLGKGGFGEVFLARNKLDDNDYAIKRIALNPKSEHLNQKIKREAKLFSKLNHEHVVRYYAAWIESISLNSEETESSLSTPTTKEKSSNFLKDLTKDDYYTNTNSSLSPNKFKSSINKNNQHVLGKLWKNSNLDDSSHKTVNHKQKFQTLFSQHTAFQSKSAANDSDFDVVFVDDEEDENFEINKEETEYSDESQKVESSKFRFQQILYIQMEYCSNSTLKSLIDSSRLYNDTTTIWRLFREILSGLHYIHHQNMIHRDIKPMNIFLDNNWSVKIGDFGLATRDLFNFQNDKNSAYQKTVDLNLDPIENKKTLLNESLLKNENSGFTKDVGTAMYIAPEIKGKSTVYTKFYTSKTDVYSVGIVLFEMFYKPTTTESKRIYTLQALRNNLDFPDDFGLEITNHYKNIAKKLITWMLKCNPDERPSVDELLQSDMIPFVEEEEDEFQKMFVQTLHKRKSRLYKWMITTIFNQQKISPALKYCFDQPICLDQNKSFDCEIIIDRIKRELTATFRIHAFNKLSTHLILPLNLTSNSKDKNELLLTNASGQHECVLLDSSGLPIMLPTNLRQSFIRYCARNGISRIKRYTFGKVFFQSDLSGGLHPIERNECCVDLIDDLKSREFIAAQCISLSADVVKNLSILENLKWTLVIGHAHFIKATCLHLGIADKSTQNTVFNALYHLSTINKKLTNEQKCELIINSCSLTHQLAASLLKILEPANDFNNLCDQLRSLTRSKTTQVCELTRDALNEIYKLLTALRCFNGNTKFDHIIFDPSLSYRPQIFNDGLIYFFKAFLISSNQVNTRALIVLAGGAFESCINDERRTQDPMPNFPICAYGFNLTIENLVQLYQFRRLRNLDENFCSVYICSSTEELNSSKYNLLHKFWEFGVAADVLHESLSAIDSVLEYCQKNSINFLLVLIETDEAVLYVNEATIEQSHIFSTQCQTWFSVKKNPIMGYRASQEKMSINIVFRIILTFLFEKFSKNSSIANTTNFLLLNSKMLVAPVLKTGGDLTQFLQCLGNINLNFPELNLLGTSSGDSTTTGLIHNPGLTTATLGNINITFAMNEKPYYRKKIENCVRNVLNNDLLPKLSVRTRVEVFVSELPPEILRNLAANLNRHYENLSAFRQVIDNVQRTQKISGRHKSDLETLVSLLQPLCCDALNLKMASNLSSSFQQNELTAHNTLNNLTMHSAGNNMIFSNSVSHLANTSIIVLWCKNVNVFYKIII